MKNISLLLSALLLSVFAANADTSSQLESTTSNNRFMRAGYGNSFIFTENGIEFSVYTDGQFDFYMPNYAPRISANYNNRYANISFNTGCNYDAYLQYDEFGAVVQIENTPLFYDFYGRINQIGNIFINYNTRGYVNRVGGLNVFYNRFNNYSHCTGFINHFNRGYVYRPWHDYYRFPSVNYRVVFTTPYRRHYTPIRYRYDRPYLNNNRRKTAVATRRGNTVTRNRALASRSKNRVASKPRTRNNRVTTNQTITRGNKAVKTLPKVRHSNTVSSKPRPKTVQNRNAKPRTRNTVNTNRSNNTTRITNTRRTKQKASNARSIASNTSRRR